MRWIDQLKGSTQKPGPGYDVKLHPGAPLSKEYYLSSSPYQGYGEAIGNGIVDCSDGHAVV